MPTYRIVTLGCKLNQAESAAVEAALQRLGLTRADEAADAGAPDGGARIRDAGGADLVVLNTCTVTAGADREARRIARGVRRDRPGATLIVTGCYAERDAAALQRIAGADHVVGLRDQAARVADLAARSLGLAAPAEPEPGRFGTTGSCEPGFGDHTRAFLKIQDGCDLRCAYCVIPSVRGPGRSLPETTILERLRGLAARGYREIVFTGVNTGDWGRDLVPERRLHDLLPAALEAAAPARLRLNSLEPRTVTPAIVRLMADSGTRLARHLQVPLQSGCDAVLARMRRNYRSADYAHVVEALAGAVPDAAIGADVIVGFPGETDAEFEITCRLIERLPLAYLHVFPYSARPGTGAAALPGAPAAAIVRERGARLRALAAEHSLRFRRRFIGRTLPVLVLRGRRPDGRLRGLSDNYIDLGLDAEGAAAGTLVNQVLRARVIAADADDTLAAVA